MNYVIKWKVWWDTRTYLHRLVLAYGLAITAVLAAGFIVFKTG